LSDQALVRPSTLHSHLSVHLPRLLSEVEFDEAELEARLVLHQLDADSKERIDIVRGSNSVQVKGIVATEDRKREIESHLHVVSNVVVAIYTFDELESRESSAGGVTSLKQSSVVETPSPLETYLTVKGAGGEEIRQLGLRL
jgi:hypothetical protein